MRATIIVDHARPTLHDLRGDRARGDGTGGPACIGDGGLSILKDEDGDLGEAPRPTTVSASTTASSTGGPGSNAILPPSRPGRAMPALRGGGVAARPPRPAMPRLDRPAAPPPAVADTPAKARRPRRRRRRLASLVLFVALFLAPTALAVYYYGWVASPQFRAEAQFSVRGTSEAGALSQLGLTALPGASSQHADSYILTDYLESEQVILDLLENQGLDVRRMLSREDIDPVFRLEPDIPVEDLLFWWNWLTNVEFNAVTSNTRFEVYAFRPEDAVRIADAVLAESQRVVNELSLSQREELITVAREEVVNNEERLAEIEAQLRRFRDENALLDPTATAAAQNSIITTLESQLAELETRRRALAATVSASSPTLRVLDTQIRALRAEIEQQRAVIGSGSAQGSGDDNLAAKASEFAELVLRRDFAVQTLTSARTALETALSDARKQQRYLAVYVRPREPTSTIYPRRVVNTLIAAFWFFVLWAVVTFVYRSVRDHAI